jgi:hypothetical protein
MNMNFELESEAKCVEIAKRFGRWNFKTSVEIVDGKNIFRVTTTLEWADTVCSCFRTVIKELKQNP